jgi:ankyrin repeat protein
MYCKYDAPELIRDIFNAVAVNDVANMQFYITDGADPDMRHPDTGMPLLHTAVAEQKYDMVKLLLGFQADPNLRGGPSGYTALHFAAYRPNEKIARLLIENHAELDATAANRQTPLHLAAHFGSLAVTQALVEAGADYTLKDGQGRTPRETSVAQTDDSFSFSHQPYLEVTRYLWQKETGETLEQARNEKQHQTAQTVLEALEKRRKPGLRLKKPGAPGL